MNLHLTYRHLALALSRAGYPTLRFDYAGTGDSSGSPRDPGWTEGWEIGFAAASEYLLSRSTATSLALFGARLGGTLAAHFAARHKEVDALLLWGPYLTGRAFLRNERALHQIMNANPASRKPSLQNSDDREFVGFLYNGSTRAQLESINLLENERTNHPDTRIFAWDSDSNENRLAITLAEQAGRVEFSRPHSYSSDKSLEEQAVPKELIQESLNWLNRLDEPAPKPRLDIHVHTSMPPRASVVRSAALVSPIEEEALYFGEDKGLFGIISHAPKAATPSGRPGLILVSGGNNPRAGINRNYTEWARNAALHGITTLRFDIRGLGDSPPKREENLNQLYRHETRNDLRAAVDLLHRQNPQNGIVLCGLCAGAFQALHAAIDDPRVTGVILLDLLRWDLNPMRVRRIGFFDRRRRNFEHAADRFRMMFMRSEKIPKPTLLGKLLTQLVDRKVHLLTIGCRNRGGHDQFIQALKPIQSQLEASGHFALEALENTDHIFSPLWAQEWLSQRLIRAIDEFAESPAAASVQHKIDPRSSA